MWREKPYDIKSDIWSLGCVLYEMISLQPPFRAASMKELYECVLKGKYPPIPEFYSNDLAYVVSKMLQVKPANRPTTGQILNLGVVKKRLDVRHTPEERAELLQTIMIPKDL